MHCSKRWQTNLQLFGLLIFFALNRFATLPPHNLNGKGVSVELAGKEGFST
jgi:hypothetical protein